MELPRQPVLPSTLSELFPPEQVTIVSGDGSAFSSLPFDHLVSEIDTFIASHDRLVKAACPDGPTSEDHTSIVDDKQYKILTYLIDDARAHGARIIEVGHRPDDAARRPRTLAPTVVLGVTDDMRFAHGEIFGSVLPIFSYRNLDDAINYVNARPRPLAPYYFGGVGASEVGRYNGIEGLRTLSHPKGI